VTCIWTRSLDKKEEETFTLTELVKAKDAQAAAKSHKIMLKLKGAQFSRGGEKKFYNAKTSPKSKKKLNISEAKAPPCGGDLVRLLPEGRLAEKEKN